MTGIIANIIADEARKAELVVISQHGEHEQWSSGLLGSTTESVVRKSPVPVLVTPGTYRQFDNILSPMMAALNLQMRLNAPALFLVNPAGV